MNEMKAKIPPIGSEPDAARYVQVELSPALKEAAAWADIQAARGAVHVTEGYFVCRRLRYSSQYRDLPDYSSAITSLCVSPEGQVFGATSGETAQVFAYDPRPPFDAVMPVAALEGEAAVRRSLVWEKGRTVICGTRAGALYRITAPGFGSDNVQEWGRTPGEVERLGVPVAGEGVAALAIDRLRGRVYGLSDKTGVFFILDTASGKVEVRGPVDKYWMFSENLMISPGGEVLTTGAGGRIVRYDPVTEELASAGEARLASYPGRGCYSRIDSWTYDAVSGLFYVGDKADGLLETVDPRTLEVRLLGKPTGNRRIRALAAGLDGRIFGMAGAEGELAQMFVYEPGTGELKNLGIPLATIEEKRYGFEFEAAATGPQGQIYFGESEVQSRLFVYFPAHKAASNAEGRQEHRQT